MAGRHRDTYIFATEYNRKPHHFFRKFLTGLLVLILVGLIVNVIYSYNLVYTRVPITIANLPGDMENFSILHLSDLHGRRGLGGAVSKALGQRSYSCVVMTGDMLGDRGDTEGLDEVLRALPKDIPKLLIPGDDDADYMGIYAHASLSPYADWAVHLMEEGVTILDEPYLMTRGQKGSARIWFVPLELYTQNLDGIVKTYQGVLDRLPSSGITEDQAAQKRVAEYQIARVARIRESVKTMTADDIQVAVTHTPINDQLSETLVSWTNKTDVFSMRQVSLILAGHYCGGQWRVPGGGAVYVPDFGWFPEDDLFTGITYVGRIPQYVSPGLGWSRAYPFQPFRLFNSPVVSSVELTQKMVQQTR